MQRLWVSARLNPIVCYISLNTICAWRQLYHVVSQGGQTLTIAVYPGRFDPITNGHLDIVNRAAKLFEKLIIGIYATPNKSILFTSEKRVELAKLAVAHLPTGDSTLAN